MGLDRESVGQSVGDLAGAARRVDEAFMSRALELAWQAAGRTAPNPLVGAVIVNDGTVVGEGYHHRCGAAHAEVEALEQAGDRARGATMYVSLEPCAHYGRTPPCADRVASAGVRRVVIPTIDPDEKVRGRGIEKLRAAGVDVEVGCFAGAAVATNLSYYKQRLGLGATVVLKMALTLDGRIASAPGRRDRVSGEAAQLYVHRWRANSDGIVVGLETARVDDPDLDCRLVDCGARPVPVVLDTGLELDADNRWARAGRPYVLVAGRAGRGRAGAHERAGGRVLECPSGGDGLVDVGEAVERLRSSGIERILVEGGARVFTSFLRAGVWDAMLLLQAPKAFGVGGVPVYAGEEGATPDAVAVDAVRLDGDFLNRYLNRATYDEIVSRL